MIKLSKEEQAQTLANYLPGGSPFAGKNVSGTNIRNFLLGLASELLRTDEIIELIRTQLLPETTDYYISEWESAVGIPDACFDNVGTDAERRLQIIVKLACMNAQTSGDFITLAAKFGVTVKIIAGSVHGAFPYIFPILFLGDGTSAHHHIVVDANLDITAFPYTFPILFGASAPALIECLFNQIKPATVKVLFFDLP